MSREGAGMLGGGFLIFVGALLVWFAGPDHGVNGFTVLGVLVAAAGLVVVELVGAGRTRPPAGGGYRPVDVPPRDDVPPVVPPAVADRPAD